MRDDSEMQVRRFSIEPLTENNKGDFVLYAAYKKALRQAKHHKETAGKWKGLYEQAKAGIT